MAHFSVIAEVKTETIVIKKHSKHIKKDRKDRRKTIERILGKGKVLTSFVVDKNHENGFTRDYLLDNGVVMVVNEESKKYITIIVPRVGQIRRYFKDGIVPPQYKFLLKIARYNEMMGYNEL